MNPTEHTGMNRTGVQMSPVDSKAMQQIDGLSRGAPGSDEELVELRCTYINNAEPLGSVPPPTTFSGVVSSGMSTLLGDDPQVLLDKLGERLAFERTGTRLYDALITKCRALLDSTDISMNFDDLHRIRDDEARHFALLADAIDALGGDPTAITPSADLAGVESAGLVQVLNDPRTTLAQCLHAIMVAELADRAGWETLVALADEQEKDDLVDAFADALDEEREHLALVQTWYEEAIGLTYGEVEIEVDEMAQQQSRQPPPTV
jgi:rubrerythrin